MADLITLAQYKDITAKTNDKDDTLITNTIPGVSNFIRTYCNRNFIDYYAADKIEYFSFTEGGHEVVFLNETPIVNVVSVEERANPTEAYTTLTVNSDYVINTELDAIYRITSSGGRKLFCDGVDAIKVTYKAGFSVTPQDILLAASDLITYYIKDEYIQEKTNLSFTIRSPGSSSKQGDGNLPDHIKRVLDMYRNNV